MDPVALGLRPAAPLQQMERWHAHAALPLVEPGRELQDSPVDVSVLGLGQLYQLLDGLRAAGYMQQHLYG